MLDLINSKIKDSGEKLLFCVVTGSKAYGLANAGSDTDIRFVYSNPLNYYLGFDSSYKDSMPIGGNDVFGYELKKFVRLCASSNPSALEVLFSDRKDILHSEDSFYMKLLATKHRFLSKKVFTTYANYARGQVEKAKRCTAPVVQTLVMLEDLLTLNGVDKNTTINNKHRALPVVGSDWYANVGDLVDTYKKFKQDKFPYSDLGEKRKNNVLSYGYDTKNMAHAVRLTIACTHILRTPYAYSPKIADKKTVELLLDIKNGKYTIEQVEVIFENLLLEAKVAYDNSKLPEEVQLSSFSDNVRELLLW